MPQKKAKVIEEDSSMGNDTEYSSDEDIQLQPKKKKKLSETVSDNFVFDPNFDSDTYWESLLKSIKGRKPKTLPNQVEATQQIKVESTPTPVKTNSDDELSDEDLVEDQLSEWNTDKKKKACKDNELLKDFVDINKEIMKKDVRNFHELNLSRPLLKAICEMNYSDPTPIQIATIPYALAGKDICGCAATGTGKTAAYMLPVLERLIYRPKRNMAVTRVLVLVPTRELGVQVYDNTCKFSKYTDVEVGLSIGGLDAKVQEASLRKHPDIVIATPGRLVDHLHNSPTFSLDAIDVLIIDEADRILDENFEDQLKEITRQCSYTRQTMLFSATMTSKVQDLAKVSLKNPVKLFVNSGDEVQRNVRQEFIRIRDESKRDAYLASLICRTFRDRCIVFVHMKKDARRLAATFNCLGLRVGELHGNLSQAKRLDVLEQFKNQKIDILFATDVAARGIDIPRIKTVINYKMPFETKQYIHRVGRTARAGRVGVSVSLFASKSEIKCMQEIFGSSVDKPKKRTISIAIIDKYLKKLETVREKVHEALQNDLAERLIVQEEKKIKEMEEKIRSKAEIDKAERKRSWFESKKERRKKQKQLNIDRKNELNKSKNRPGYRFKKVAVKKKKSQQEQKMSMPNVNMQHLRNQIRTIKCKSRKRKIKAYDE